MIAIAGFACGAGQRPARTAMESFTVDNGVVVSADTVYVMSADAGLVALDLATGRQRWAAGAFAVKPLVVAGGAVIAADEAGTVRVLDAGSGEPRAPCSTVPGLKIGIADRRGYTHASRGWLAGGRPYVYWLHRAVPGGESAPGARPDEGIAVIDTRSCTAERVDRAEEPATPRGTKFHLDENKLHREHGGRRLTTIELPANATITPSADRRHVIVGNANKIEFHDIDSGDVVETTMVEYPSGGMLRGRLLVYGGVAVHVFDIDKQREIWSRPLRPTHYAYPPAQVTP